MAMMREMAEISSDRNKSYRLPKLPKFSDISCMKVVELWTQDPPNITRIEGFDLLNSATFAASSYVVPPTMKTNTSDGRFD